MSEISEVAPRIVELFGISIYTMWDLRNLQIWKESEQFGPLSEPDYWDRKSIESVQKLATP